eukprot:CAMPEP_0179895282 /NCGR_PEP_ID=MMETSP0982-20121206/35741_1 /TAXON_ID=483367 /ORGANISM="non described non described, Strain CCMP 2436" /LENGTH=39 /DNA_ID= /DNA_START= /DNA_END= /DNA_ORIENTATION=
MACNHALMPPAGMWWCGSKLAPAPSHRERKARASREDPR